MYKRLFTKIKENYSLKKEVQARMKSNARLIKEQILAEKGTLKFNNTKQLAKFLL